VGNRNDRGEPMKTTLVAILGLALAGCATFNGSWKVEEEYCETAGTDHIQLLDVLKGSSYWNGIAASRDGVPRWELNVEKADRWQRMLIGNAKTNADMDHYECILIRAITKNDKKGIEVFLRPKELGDPCDQLVTLKFLQDIRDSDGMCPMDHTGGWIAYQDSTRRWFLGRSK
jgi:hypothetical protein